MDFWHKINFDGSFERQKTRLVGEDARQHNGINCSDTFSPIVKSTIVHTVMSLALSKSWCLHQWTSKMSFFMIISRRLSICINPWNFVILVIQIMFGWCLLKKSLYGLKQAPHAWYQRFDDYVSKISFTHSISDNSLFIYRKGNDMAYLLLYVDDIILTPSFEQSWQCLALNFLWRI